MRDYELLIPQDCCASNTPRENEQALAVMRKFLKADTRPSDQIELRAGESDCAQGALEAFSNHKCRPARQAACVQISRVA